MKRRNPEVPPYLSMCLIVRDSERRLPGGLEACLQSIRNRAPDAEIVIVDTMSSDERTIEISKRYADIWEQYTGPEGNWTTTMDAFDDAAAARQRSFELAHGVWRGWADDDDRIVGAEEAERLLRLNGRWKPEMGAREVVEDAPGQVQAIGLEELLHLIELNNPEIDCICAPYLYRRGAKPEERDMAESWQDRERIVKWSRGWKWVEPGHEVMVPINDAEPHGTLHLEHMLYVHEKKWNAEDVDYSVRRHARIMLARYENGDRSYRVLRYLCIYGATMPDRWEEFTHEFVRCANTPMDAYRAHCAAGDYATFRGMYLEAISHYGAATSLAPTLPDAWILGARAAEKATDWSKAVEWYRRALLTTPNYADCVVTPREFTLNTPVFAAQAMQELAKVLVQYGRHGEATAVLTEAARLVDQVARNPNIGADSREANAVLAQVRNVAEGQKIAEMFDYIYEYLRRNDETIKAADLIDLAPHTIEDHPLIVQRELQSRKLRLHLGNKAAYADFYETLSTTTDAIPTHIINADWLKPETSLPRVRMLLEWLRAHPEATEVVEIGSYDGIVAVPVLRACPWVHYTAVDANSAALARLRSYAIEHVPDADARLTTIQATEIPDAHLPLAHFDVAVLFEVIEHVPDPVETVQKLQRLLRPETGRLFISTPWGAYDDGMPDESRKPRDPRAHVRAMTLWNFVQTLRKAEVEPVEVFDQHLPHGTGDTLQSISRRVMPTAVLGPKVNFFVPSALWDWNSRLVHNTGMGASEKTIVDLAARWASMGGQVHVFGPVNEEEVHRGVTYLAREKVRHVDPEVPIVVSRSPAATNTIDALVRVKRKFLWLQDAAYPDLSPITAAAYEKIVVLTQWHEDMMAKRHHVPREKMVQINNFLNEEMFDVRDPPTREPFHFIYSSSPDRGLMTLLKMWPEILERWPKATLDIFYGWEGAQKLAWINPTWTSIYRDMRAEYDGLVRQPGVRAIGRVSPSRLAREMMRASVWAYPTHFGETGCATSFEVQAAGCVPVCTPYAGLAETAASKWTQFIPIPRTEEGWVGGKPANEAEAEERQHDYTQRFLEGISTALAMSPLQRRAMAITAVEKYRLSNVIAKWNKLLWG